MKTENLSWAEAIKAYADHHKIEDKHGNKYWMDGGKPKTSRYSHDVSGTQILTDDAPFRIVKPGPKTLTFDEAVQALESGKDVGFLHLPKQRYIVSRHTWPAEMAILDLAERKGWPITVAE